MISSIFNKRRGLVHRRVRRSFRGGGSFSCGGFTLVELLTVIVIIAILVALLFPAIKTTILKAETNQAKADTEAIENAIQSYRNEYGKLPTQTSDQGGADQLYDSSNAYHIYNTLRAISSGWNSGATALNPRGIAFLETPSRKGAFDGNGNFLDPWGGTYLLVFDCNYNGLISVGSYTNLPGPALVISYGPDRVSSNVATAADDIVNYK
ncbi:MAG: hypothetical protein PCFJNLEI_02194 [Verrucomicrobiae bacterium]|nr:hypothetical protein [Verrucomicrobiae bacterium]